MPNKWKTKRFRQKGAKTEDPKHGFHKRLAHLTEFNLLKIFKKISNYFIF
jgi:hypothetical protein